VSDKHDGVSYADVFQLASATAIELAGGPKIPLRFGRRDARSEEDCCPEGRLPGLLYIIASRCCRAECEVDMFHALLT
jgi:L-ascorbate peroxidase